jgi:hypothetical protein
MPLKKPVDGDFRVQSLFEDSTLCSTTNTTIEKPKNCQYIPDHLLYARVDGIIINSELQWKLNVLNRFIFQSQRKCTGTLYNNSELTA